MEVKVGDVVRYNGIKVEVISINCRGNGYGIIYLEGPMSGWLDWALSQYMFSELEREILYLPGY